MNRIFYIILLTGLTLVFAEEVLVNATNTMRFGTGKEWVGEDKDIEIPKQYFEDWIDIEASKGNFRAGLRFEAADSSSYNETFKRSDKAVFQLQQWKGSM